MSNLNNMLNYMKEKGWDFLDTGGGCTAYTSVEYKNRYVWIDNDNDAPSSIKEHCCIGFYSDEYVNKKGIQTGPYIGRLDMTVEDFFNLDEKKHIVKDFLKSHKLPDGIITLEDEGIE